MSDVRYNISGIEIKTLYTEDDRLAASSQARLTHPGAYPFTRGIHEGMYRTRPWTPRMVVGLGTPSDYNKRMKELYDLGLSGLFVSPSNIHLRGFDVDQVSSALINGIGVLLSTTEDLEICLDGLPLDRDSISLGDTAPYTLSAMLVAVARRRGVALDRIAGTTNQSDYLSHYSSLHMFYRIPLAAQKRLLIDHAIWMRGHMPKWNPFSVVGQHVQQAGATPAEAMGMTLASAVQYAEDLIERGEPIDEYIGRFSFFFDVSLSLFEEIAKFRAGRRVWASIVKDRFGVRDPRKQRLRFHTQTSGAELTQQEPLNNIVRVTIQALAAIFGGTQSLHTDSYDEAIGTPSRLAAQIAVDTQHIIREETGISDVVDPIGGSFYLEKLTDEMEELIRTTMGKINDVGGMREAVKSGLIQKMTGTSALNYQMSIERAERVVVGVNKFCSPSVYTDLELPSGTSRPNKEEVESYTTRLNRFKANRDQQGVRVALEKLQAVLGQEDANAYEGIVEAIGAGATHGEVCDAVRAVVGVGQPEVFA